MELRKFLGDDYLLILHNTKLILWVGRNTKVQWVQWHDGLQYGYREPKPIKQEFSFGGTMQPASPFAEFGVFEYTFQTIVKDNIFYLIGGNEEANKVIISARK